MGDPADRDVPSPRDCELSIEQVTEMFLGELHDGAVPSIESYAAKHNHLADEIRELFPTLVRLERIAPTILAPRSQDHLQQGARIGHFHIKELIGRGGMAEVYSAEDTRIKRMIALKLIRRSESDEKVRLRFQSEAMVVGQFHHTNIVPVFDAGSDGEFDYIAMQLIDGASLASMMDQLHLNPSLMGWKIKPSDSPAATNQGTPIGGLSRNSDSTAELMMTSRADGESGNSLKHYYENVARVGRQVADAIAYSHDQGVLHRDIKPGNVLIDSHGQAWVTDFGLAKSEKEHLTKTGDLVGTLSYMAPERLTGMCDQRSDIYSLGATIHCLLAGHPPNHVSTDSKHVGSSDNAGQAHTRIPREVPNELAAIVRKCIAANPIDRYKSAAHVCDDFDRFLAGEPVAATRRNLFVQLSRWAQRNSALACVTGVLLITLASAAILATFVAARLERQKSELVRVSEELKNERDQLLKTTTRLSTANRILEGQLRDGTVERLVASWTKAIETFPDAVMPYISRAELYMYEQYEYDLALKDFESALANLEKLSVEELNRQNLWGQYHSVRCNIAVLLTCGPVELRDYHRSVELSKKVMAYSREWWVLNALGYAYYRLGEHELADRVLDEAIADMGDTPDSDLLAYSAMAKFRLGDTKGARQRAQAAIDYWRMDPVHPFDEEAVREAASLIGISLEESVDTD